MGGDAQLSRHLDFLIYGESNADAQYRVSVPINVPTPERYAIPKMIVAQLRIQPRPNEARAAKDIRPSEALLDVLLEDRSFEVEQIC